MNLRNFLSESNEKHKQTQAKYKNQAKYNNQEKYRKQGKRT